MKPFSNRLNTLVKNGIPALSDSVYLIVIAEKKGFPPVEKSSIAHSFENMWLASTALGLGFQLISAVSILGTNKEFLKLLNLKKEYEFNGCIVGIPLGIQPKLKNYNVDDFMSWML